jgi:hypothetical protein
MVCCLKESRQDRYEKQNGWKVFHCSLEECRVVPAGQGEFIYQTEHD